MQGNLISFIQVLRSHDVRISPAETLDALAAASTLGYDDRERLRHGLGMTLAKTPEEEAVYQQCFDQFFQRQLAGLRDSDQQQTAAADPQEKPAAAPDQPTPADGHNAAQLALEQAAADNTMLAALMETPLMQSLLENDRNQLSLAMTRAAGEVGLNEISLFTQKGQFTRKILDAMGEEQIRQTVIALESESNAALPALQRYRDSLRSEVRDYVERQYLLHAQGKNRQFMDDILSTTRLNNIEHVYVERVRELVQKMVRKLASRYAQKRPRSRRGQLHMAKTLRQGIATDGIMFTPSWRRVRKKKPQIMAICDVSGSVASYARFLLLFLYSLQDVLPKVRSFAFSSHLGEVSSYFDEYSVEKAIELINWHYAGSTDYGASLADFTKLAIDEVNACTTVIILGDARNNHGDAKLELLQSICQRARQVIWLNPESRRAWGTGDSDMLRYASACHFVAECNNLRQLERIVDQLLKSTR